VGTVEGDHHATATDDGTVERLAEALLRDDTPAATSALDHTWMFDVPQEGLATLRLTALVTDGGDDDGFQLSWTTDGHTYTTAVTLLPGDELLDLTLELGPVPAGPLWLRITDLDRSPGATTLDQITIDQLVIDLTTTAPSGGGDTEDEPTGGTDPAAETTAATSAPSRPRSQRRVRR
jgi:hypothetical protein